jgi:subtilase family serine protease
VNNTFQANSGFVFQLDNYRADAFAESDYNNLFTSGSFIGRIGGTNYGDLAAWRTATNQEAQSIAFDPQYESATSLYASAPALAAAGKNLSAEVPDDIDGLSRSTTPSIGANQFGASANALAGEYTIWGEGTGDRNFTTIQEALDALKNNGISAPVVFKLTGEFNEQLQLLAISGATTDNTLTFESASGNPEDAIIRFAATTDAGNYTVRLSNADYYTLRNLTLRAEGSTYGRVLVGVNRLRNFTLEGNRIEMLPTTATTTARGGVVLTPTLAENVLILGNYFVNGSYGILFNGASASNRAVGTRIYGNTIEKSFHRGISLTYHLAAKLEQNVIVNNPSSSSFTGIDFTYQAGAFRILGNKVTGGNSNALYIFSGLSSENDPALIANNFFQTNNTGSNQTVQLNYLRHVNFYHNNINATGTGPAFYYISNSGNDIRIFNNIFRANTGYALNVVSPNAISGIDYNNYYTDGANLARWDGVDRIDFPALQAATNQDLNSLAVDPQYLTSTDLQALAGPLAGAGLDLTDVVPDDINGNPRTLPVSMGASQFSPEFSIDASVAVLLSPASACELTNSEVISFEIGNLGASPITSLQVGYQINGGSEVLETLSGIDLLPGRRHTYTFNQTADLSEKGDYTLRVFVVLAGDENEENDFRERLVRHFPAIVTTISPDAEVCTGEQVTLAATGGVQYTWSTGATSATINVTPLETITYTVLIRDVNGCSAEESVTLSVRSVPSIAYVGSPGFTDSYMSPTQGPSDTPFEFRMRYFDANGSMPANGSPRIELDANNNGRATDPLDIILSMMETDPTDEDVTNGKEYRAVITGLSDQINWRSRIFARNQDGCAASTPFVASPLVSNNLLDISIYANDISFSKSNPAINEPITLFARIRNTSDYDAENFVVSAYAEDDLVYTTVVPMLRAKSNVTVQWEQAFPQAGFYPIKVVIDETHVLDEINELNNFAIRPIIVGDYELPGGIDPGATVGPLEVQPNAFITVTGKAQYFGIESGVNPDVAGALAQVAIVGGRQSQVNTGTDGTYSLAVRAPLTPGIYTLNVSVTDYTLTGVQGPITFEVLQAPPRPDLASTVQLSTTTILAGQSVNGVATVRNEGDLNSGPFVFRYFNCEEVFGEVEIEDLAPGQVLTYTFTASPTVVGDCFNRNNCLFRSIADPHQVVDDKNRNNNQASTSLTVLPTLPDLTPMNVSNTYIPGFVNKLNPFTFNVRVDNIGGVHATETFDVNVYFDEVLVHTQTVPGLNFCGFTSFSVTHVFSSLDDHLLAIRVDEPLGSGVVEEYRETNNEFTKTIKHSPPPTQFPNLNVRAADISVHPAHPVEGAEFQVHIVYRNNGQVPVEVPFDVRFTVTEEGVERSTTETVTNPPANGQTRELEFTTQIAAYGNHRVGIRLDPENVVEEPYLADNYAEMPLCVDFSVTGSGGAWPGNFYVGSVRNLTANVRNLGLFTAQEVSVVFYLNDVLIASTVIPHLPPTYSGSGHSISIPHLFDEVGEFELKVVVDEPNAYIECNEANNTFARIIRVLEPLPDVRVLSEYISPTKINPDIDEPITIFLSYDNIGIGSAATFMARILVDDEPLGADVVIPALGPGQNSTVEIPTPYVGTTAGTRIIRAILDPEQVLTETTRANNEATRAIFVGLAPNLRFSEMVLTEICPVVGQEIRMDARVVNEGDQPTDAEVHFFYITEIDTVFIDKKSVSLDARGALEVDMDWLVISSNFSLYAEIRNADPDEFDLTDNSIRVDLCGEPFFNFQVSAVGQGIARKTPGDARIQRGTSVVLEAIPATGWRFIRWVGDIESTENPYQLVVMEEMSVSALFEEFLAPVVQNGQICGEGSVVLTASGAGAGESYRWYTQAEGGQPLEDETGPTFTTPVLTTSTSWWVSIVAGDLESPRAEVRAVILTGTPATITYVAGVLRANEGTTYQWYRNGQAISGANARELALSFTLFGIYRVEVTYASGCTSLSDSFDYLITADNEQLVAGFYAYPNPLGEVLFAGFEGSDRPAKWKLFDMQGRQHLTIEASSVQGEYMGHLSPGVYVLQVELPEGMIRVRLVKK